ncbi:MAG TPA: hypothetical protein VMT03_18430 [Polyangia bacterium]|nr:hypothetical protein [Polyangia bacterium]
MTSTSPFLSCLRFARRLAAPVLAASLVACGSSSNPTTTGTAMVDANNYTATSQLNIPVIPTASGMDVTLDWSTIQKDLLCHPATGIQSVTLAAFRNKTQAALEADLAVGVFNANEVYKYFVQDFVTMPYPTTTMLSSLGPSPKLSPMTDYVESSSTLYLLLFSNTTKLGQGAESMAILQPMASNSATTVSAPDGCGPLNFSATLGTPMNIPKAGPSYPVDWGKLTKDGFGQPIQFGNIDGIEVGYYQSMSASDLQTHFLDVEVNADKLYQATFSAGTTSFDLTGAKLTDGTVFSGFGDAGTYAMALRCSTCSVPAPLAFTILNPQ